MTITIEINPQTQTWLQTEAVHSGVDIPRYVQALIEGAAARQRTGQAASADPLPASADDPTLALFVRWDAEDATDDPQEIARRRQDGDALQEALAKNSVSLRPVPLPEGEAA